VTETIPRTDNRGSEQITYDVFWRETEPVEVGPSLRGNRQADVAIIGAGYTGLWTAHFLKKADPSLSIEVVEADYAGSGASGHGDGFITPTIGHSLATLVHAYGPERARLAYSVVGKSILEVQRFATKHGIDAQIEPTGYFQVATTDAQRRLLDRDLELVAQLGARTAPELLSGAELRQHIDSPALLGGFKVGGAMVNPHRLVRGLTRVVREQGVVIHERSKALDVRRTPTGHVVRTAGGQLTASRLLYATNAYQHQFQPFDSMVRPYWSYAIVTEPLTPDQLAMIRWPGREGFVEARNFIAFARLTAQNRLLVGGGPVPYHYGKDMDSRHMRSQQALASLRQTLARYFPAWKDVRVTNSYGGCIDMTPDFVPHVGRLADGAFYAHGYCGNGVAFTNTVGKVLRDLILGVDSTYTDLLFVGPQRRTYPSEPLAWLQSTTRNALMRIQDRYPAVIRRELL
jgi:glycine/D-amino acid oxidase-like deaminating enzyme